MNTNSSFFLRGSLVSISQQFQYLSFACYELLTYLYCLQELWQWQVPWGCRQGQRLLPPRYPTTLLLRASAPCCSCPARTSRPLVAVGYLPCQQWPVLNHTNKYIHTQKETVTINSEKLCLLGSIKWWHADTEIKWMKCWVEASRAHVKFVENLKEHIFVDGIFGMAN